MDDTAILGIELTILLSIWEVSLEPSRQTLGFWWYFIIIIKDWKCFTTLVSDRVDKCDIVRETKVLYPFPTRIKNSFETTGFDSNIERAVFCKFHLLISLWSWKFCQYCSNLNNKANWFRKQLLRGFCSDVWRMENCLLLAIYQHWHSKTLFNQSLRYAFSRNTCFVNYCDLHL